MSNSYACVIFFPRDSKGSSSSMGAMSAIDPVRVCFRSRTLCILDYMSSDFSLAHFVTALICFEFQFLGQYLMNNFSTDYAPEGFRDDEEEDSMCECALRFVKLLDTFA